MGAETYPTVISVEEFVAGTPEVPAEWIECVECGEEYIGDPDHADVCPRCRPSETEGL